MRFLPLWRQGFRAAALTALFLAAAPLGGQSAPPPDDVVRPGDVVRITVFRKPELSGEMEVGPSGTLLHPLYRAIPAAGATVPVLEQRLGEFLLRYEAEPSFVVETLHRVSVGGEVRAPGVFSVRPGTTVYQAVFQAGGGSSVADLRHVRLVRDGAVQVLDLTNRYSPQGNLTVRSGDVLMVDRRANYFREFVSPAATIVAAAAALVNLFRRR